MRRSTSARWTRSSARIRMCTWRQSAGIAPRSMRLCISRTSCTRSNWRCLHSPRHLKVPGYYWDHGELTAAAVMNDTIRHVTKFVYEAPISESVMEARMQPRSDLSQHCIRFGLSTTPASRVRMYQDPDGNMVHHFSIPGRHSQLIVTAEAFVECAPLGELPDSLGPGAWERLDAATASGEFWDLLNPSTFAKPTELLGALAHDLSLARSWDPIRTLRILMSGLHQRFEYKPKSTRVDSPIDEAL